MTEPPLTMEAEIIDENTGEGVSVVRHPSMVRAAPGDVIEAFKEYQQIQEALDKSLPACLMSIRGKQFRRKNYWRAIATAFNLTVELRNEERRDDPSSNDWGYLVTYR